MENDFPNQTTSQLLIQHFSEAALFTDPGFAITACNPAASALFLYNQQDILGQSITFLLSPSSKTNSQPVFRELSEHLLNIRETERTRIAREIHDELGQQLTILKMDLSWLNQKLKKCEDASVLQKTGDALKVLNETIKSVRRIATELRPSMLDDLGLREAMEWQSKEFEKSNQTILLNLKRIIKATCNPFMKYSIARPLNKTTCLHRVYRQTD